jgi:hypothetical protein
MYANRFGYADKSPEENLAQVIEWYEAGWLIIESDDDGIIVSPAFHDGTAPVDGGDLHLDD